MNAEVAGTEGYGEHAVELVESWQQLSFTDRPKQVLQLFPQRPSLIIDIGAGIGVDAAGLAARGHKVAAVEPVAALRESGRQLHPSQSIEWVTNALPSLGTLMPRAGTFDLVLLSAVWMHLDEGERRRGMGRVCALLRENGRIIMSLRHGPVPDGRRMFPVTHLTERLASLRGRLGELEEIGRQLQAAPDEQISLTDPDARAMATGSDHRGVVGYNMQAAVDTKHHIVVANAVTNRGHDRSHLLEMAKAAQTEIGGSGMIALADRGYYEGEQIRSCAEAGIIPMVPKPNTSPAVARGFWGKAMFVHERETDTYRCPAGEQLQKRFARVEGGKLIGAHFNQKACGACSSRHLCTAGKEKRIRRWEHEAVLDQMERRFDAMPEAMAVRRCTVEHVLGTIKGWMGATHFRTRGLENVATEAA
ncbi:transposase [Devosia naphthalenivorans]|uniref:transposase n=1 Tax=Devosia naphthalenivorans TaxID=2082392 RepID=UPI000D35AF2E|nr:transposase [Devosia naphthalenivorans]